MEASMQDPRLDIAKANDGSLLFSAMRPANGIRFNATKENPESRFNDLSEVPIAARGQGGQYLPRYSLYLYQRLAINWMEYIETRYRSGGILGDYMGLGKTLTLTVHIVRHHKARQKTLIVCPANVVGGWVEHLVKKDFILRDSLEGEGNRVMVLGNGGVNNYMNTPPGTTGVVYNRDAPFRLLRTYEMITKDYWDQAGFVIMSYNQLRRDFNHPTMQRLMSQCWERIVFDEAHELRNLGVRPQAAMALKSEFTWAVTATPVQLGVHDFLALILLTKNPLLERRRTGSFDAFVLPYCPAAVPSSKDYREYVDIRNEMVNASKSNNNNSRTWQNATVWGIGQVNMSAYDMLEVLHINAFFLQRFPSTVLPIPGNTRPLLTLPRRTDELQRLHFLEYSNKRIRLGVIPVRNPQTNAVSNQDVTMTPADLYLEDGRTYRRLYVERIQAVNWEHNPYKNDPRRREDPEVLTMVWYMKSLIAETRMGRSSESASLLEGSQAFGFQRINQQRAAALHPLLVIPAVAPGTDIKLAKEFIESVVEPFHTGGPIDYALGQLTVHESVEQPTDDPSSIEVDLSAHEEEFGSVQTESRRKERWDDFIDKLMIDDMQKGKVDPASVSDETVRIARSNDVAIRFIENTSACTDVNLPYEGLLRDVGAFAGSDMCDDLIPVEVLRRVRELLVSDPSKLPAMNPEKREYDIKRIDVVLRQRTNSHNFYSFPIRMRILMYAMNQPWHDLDSAYIGEERFRPAQWSPKIWAIVKRVMQIRAARHYEYTLPDGKEVVGYERIVIFTQNMGMSYLVAWALGNLGKLNPEAADKLAADIGVPDFWKRKPSKDNVALVNGQTPENKETRVKILRSFDKDPKLGDAESALLDEQGRENRSVPNYDLFRKWQILVITMRVGGVGLNLDSANHVIVCDPWYNPQLVDQAIARCYRVTQARDLHVYRMVMNRTPESTIYDKENARREFASVIMRKLADTSTGDTETASKLTELGEFYESMRRVEESAAFEQSMRSATREEWIALSQENLPAEDKMHMSFKPVSAVYSTTPTWNAPPIKAEAKEVLVPVRASRIRRAADVVDEEEALELAKFVSTQPMDVEPEYVMMPTAPVGETSFGEEPNYPMSPSTEEAIRLSTQDYSM